MGPRNRFGNPEPRRPALVGGMVHIAAFALDQAVDQPIDRAFFLVHIALHSPESGGV